MPDKNAQLRALPSVQSVLEQDDVKVLVAKHGHIAITRLVRALIDKSRAQILANKKAETIDAAKIHSMLAAEAPSLRPVINATGVVVHTNLGRAPLSDSVCEAVAQVAKGYSTLEYNLEKGARGSRHDHAKSLLLELTGAEDACVVNNNAAAVMLCLAAISKDTEVVVSRGELVEIGGSFRVPDIMKLSGATLVEVGTTNRTRLSDYKDATRENTSLWMKVHRSNFALIGFTEEAGLYEMAREEDRPPMMYDAGSGCLLPLGADPREKPIASLIEAGIDLITFSGDKLLGGPQAGLIVGKSVLVQKIRKHQMMRALRPDKLCLAALVETLRLWRDDPEKISARAMMSESEETIRALNARAHTLANSLVSSGHKVSVVGTRNKIGGGTSPDVTIEGRALAFEAGDALTKALRECTPPVIARSAQGQVLVEMRTLGPHDDDVVLAALKKVL